MQGEPIIVSPKLEEPVTEPIDDITVDELHLLAVSEIDVGLLMPPVFPFFGGKI